MGQAAEAKSELQAVHSRGCANCGAMLRRGRGFTFKVDPAAARQGIRAQVDEITKCALCALRHVPMLRRSLAVAAVVGTIVTLLNHGDTILLGHWHDALYWKIPPTFCVPFCVATFGAMTNGRR